MGRRNDWQANITTFRRRSKVSEKFKFLFTPLQIKSLEIPNRIFQPAHAKGYDDHVENYGIPSEREAYYHVERAKGGVGLLILGEQMVHPTSGDTGGLREAPHGYREEAVPRYKMFADKVHPYGTKIFAQLSHVGFLGVGYYQDDFQQVWAPSAMTLLSPGLGIPKEMEKEDIEEVINGFARAAQNAKQGGLDGVEVHGAHGYLPHQFLSPISNKRSDKYGGSLSNRMRFLIEIVHAIREAVGEDFVFGVRISADEFLPGGLTLDDMKEVAKALEGTKEVDYIHVSSGNLWTSRTGASAIAPYLHPPGLLIPYAAAIKETLKRIPVFCVGSITTPELAEKILAEGQADMIGMCRALIADPELPNKAREGRLADIRGCIRCLQGCLLRGASSLPITCVHNPAAGREKRLGTGTLKPAEKVKKVMVIGGGPAGLKAAEVAARRKHRVVLYEKESYLGGQVKLASVAPLKQEFAEVTRYLETQVNNLGVIIKTSQEADEESVKNEQPDAVVVATGCKPIHSIYLRSRLDWVEIPGVEQENVISVWDVLRAKEKVGRKVVIIDGDAHSRNLAVADYLASDKDRSVEIVTGTNSVLPQRIHPFEGALLARRVREKGIVAHLSTQIKEIRGDKIVLLHTPTGKESVIEGVDTIVWATGAGANDDLYFKLKGKVKELYRIGDCVAPRWLDFAIWEGEKIGRSL